MNNLLWFEGITLETSVRDIGWTYVLLVFLFVIFLRIVYQIASSYDQEDNSWPIRRNWATEHCIIGRHEVCGGTHGYPDYNPCTCRCHDYETTPIPEIEGNTYTNIALPFSWVSSSCLRGKHRKCRRTQGFETKNPCNCACHVKRR